MPAELNIHILPRQWAHSDISRSSCTALSKSTHSILHLLLKLEMQALGCTALLYYIPHHLLADRLYYRVFGIRDSDRSGR